jgi:predicted RNA polymerase sigma factor
VSAPSPPRGPGDPASPSDLVEHYFRHEYGRLVAVLVRRVGLRHLEAVEDAVQAALLAALTAWVTSGVPNNSGAWLYRVAHNQLVGVLRKNQGHQHILEAAADEDVDSDEPPVGPAFASEVRDELLRMLFVCCDERIPQESGFHGVQTFQGAFLPLSERRQWAFRQLPRAPSPASRPRFQRGR